jgi:hypothetical protein
MRAGRQAPGNNRKHPSTAQEKTPHKYAEPENVAQAAPLMQTLMRREARNHRPCEAMEVH